MRFWKNKKAQGTNYVAVVLFLFLFGFMNIVAYTLWLEVVSALNTTGLVDNTIAATIANFTRGFRAFDYVIVILMVIFIIGTGLTSYKIATSTAFFILTIIMGIFWGFVSYFFNYIFIQLVSPSVFATAIGFFPRTLLLCTNLHWVMLALIIVGSLTLYGKKEKGQFLT
jgi:hypothetical protein